MSGQASLMDYGAAVALVVTGAGLVLGLVTLPLVLRAPNASHRRVALVIALEMVVLVAFGISLALTLVRGPPERPAEWTQDLPALVIGSLVSAYLFFISVLETPLVRWLRSRAARVVMVAFPLVMYGLKLSYREDFARTPDTLDVVTFFGVIGALVASNIYCLVAAIDAWRRSPRGSVHRERAKAFAVAFGTRDAMLATLFLYWIVFGFGTEGPLSDAAWDYVGPIGLPLAITTYLLLLGYGILRTQLFDIDLRVKRGVRNALILGTFVAVFFVVEQVAQQLISERAGTAAGLVGAGVLAVAFVPLKRAATRVAHLAMPGITGTPEYVASRKAEVYRMAFEEAFADGTVSAQERRRLARLGGDLALEPRVMATIEDEVRALRSAGRGAPEPGA